MRQCGVCLKSISRGENFITCSEKDCVTDFHAKCVGITEESSATGVCAVDLESWKCKTCSDKHNLYPNKRSVQGEVIEVMEEPISNLDMDKIISMKVKSAINQITEEVINILKTEITKLHKNNCHLGDEIAELKRERNRMATETCRLKQEILHLKSTINTSQVLENLTLNTGSLPKPFVPMESNITATNKNNAPSRPTKVVPSISTFSDAVNNSKSESSAEPQSTAILNLQTSSSSTVGASPPVRESHRAAPTDDYQLVQRRRTSKKSKSIMGSATTTSVKAATKVSYLYVTRLDKDTTVEELIDYLKAKSFLEISCEKMTAKRPDLYSSFKVGAPIHQINALKAPEIWPAGVYINRFFWKNTNNSPPDKR